MDFRAARRNLCSEFRGLSVEQIRGPDPEKRERSKLRKLAKAEIGKIGITEFARQIIAILPICQKSSKTGGNWEPRHACRHISPRIFR